MDINKHPHAQNLINKLDEEYKRINAELRGIAADSGTKKRDWIWYVFPTNMPGSSQINEEDKTAIIDRINFRKVLEDPSHLGRWYGIFKLINEAINKEYGFKQAIFPHRDWGRILIFLKFWNSNYYNADKTNITSNNHKLLKNLIYLYFLLCQLPIELVGKIKANSHR